MRRKEKKGERQETAFDLTTKLGPCQDGDVDHDQHRTSNEQEADGAGEEMHNTDGT